MIQFQRRLATTLLQGCMAALMLLVALSADAQEKNPKSTESKKSEQRTEPKTVTKTTARTSAPVVVDEKAALAFATAHHPELAEILQTLRKANKQQFQAALTDLSREQERIARMLERDPERAKMSIAAWQIDSRIRLEVARFTMTQDAEREARIKELLRERSDIRRRVLEFDRKRTQQRLAKYDEQLGQFDQNSDKQLAAEWERLKKSVSGQKPKPEKKP